MITDELALLAQSGDKAAITKAFKAAEAYADQWGLQNVSLEFLNVLETWNPRKGSFWKRLLFRLHRSYDPCKGRRVKPVSVDLERIVMPVEQPKPAHIEDVRERFGRLLSRLSETAQCLFVCLTKTPNQFTMQLGVEDYIYNARYWTAYRMNIEFADTLAAWDELQPLMSKYASMLEEVA